MPTVSPKMLLLLFCFLCACAAEQRNGVVMQKVLHSNGLKEFTVLKNIRGNECACACLCATPHLKEALAELQEASPSNASLDSLIRHPPIRYFQIAKEIRGNECKCSCACTDPEGEEQIPRGTEPIEQATTLHVPQIQNELVAETATATSTAMNTPDKDGEMAPNSEANHDGIASSMPVAEESSTTMEISSPKTVDAILLPSSTTSGSSSAAPTSATTMEKSPPTAEDVILTISTTTEIRSSSTIAVPTTETSTSSATQENTISTLTTGTTTESSESAQFFSTLSFAKSTPSTTAEPSSGSPQMASETTTSAEQRTTVKHTVTSLPTTTTAADVGTETATTNSKEERATTNAGVSGSEPEDQQSTTETSETIKSSDSNSTGGVGTTIPSATESGQEKSADAEKDAGFGVLETATSAGEEENASTYDPAFRAKVANLLNKLKDQLYRLREAEERENKSRVGAERGEENKPQMQMDHNSTTGLGDSSTSEWSQTTSFRQEIGKNGGTTEKMAEKIGSPSSTDSHNQSTTPEGPSSTIGMTTSEILDSTAGSAFVVEEEEEGAKTTKDDNVTQTNGLLVLGDEGTTASVDGTAETMASIARNNATEGDIAETEETTTVTGSHHPVSVTGDTTESTLSPQFKARVANLLNRLKEQLYKMRDMQRQNAMGRIRVHGETTTTASSTATAAADNTTKAERLMEGLRRKVEELRQKTFKNAAEAVEGQKSAPVGVDLGNGTKLVANETAEEGFAFVTETPEPAPEPEGPTTVSPAPANPTNSTTPVTLPPKNETQNEPLSSKKETESLFPLPHDFLVDVPSAQKEREQPGEGQQREEANNEEQRNSRNRIILLPAPPQGRALFATLGSSTTTSTTAQTTAATTKTPTAATSSTPTNTTMQMTTTRPTTVADAMGRNQTEQQGVVVDVHTHSAQAETAVPTTTSVPEWAFWSPETEDSPSSVNPQTAQSTMGTTRPSSSVAPKRVTISAVPSAQNLIERLELARRLREEQVKLEMMEAIRREQLGTDEPDPHIEERKREIENQLLQLAQAERLHREMLERGRGRGRQQEQAEAQTETDTPSPTGSSAFSPPIPCDSIRRFIRLFRIADPQRWIDANCQFAKRHFPNASCPQIGALLSECLRVTID